MHYGTVRNSRRQSASSCFLHFICTLSMGHHIAPLLFVKMCVTADRKGTRRRTLSSTILALFSCGRSPPGSLTHNRSRIELPIRSQGSSVLSFPRTPQSWGIARADTVFCSADQCGLLTYSVIVLLTDPEASGLHQARALGVHKIASAFQFEVFFSPNNGDLYCPLSFPLAFCK